MDFFDRLDHPLNFLNQRCGRGADALNDSLGTFLNGNGLERLWLLDLGRGGKVWLAETVFRCLGSFGRFPGQTFGRQTRSDVFRPLDLVQMTMVVHLFVHGRSADGFSARLSSIAIGALLAV